MLQVEELLKEYAIVLTLRVRMPISSDLNHEQIHSRNTSREILYAFVCVTFLFEIMVMLRVSDNGSKPARVYVSMYSIHYNQLIIMYSDGLETMPFFFHDCLNQMVANTRSRSRAPMLVGSI